MSGIVQAPPAALLRFVARFDHGEYWLAHEELEALWLEDRREIYKGLIHLAAASLHLERGNHGGAMTKFKSAAAFIEGDAEGLPYLNREALLATVAIIAEHVAGGAERGRVELRLADYLHTDGPLAPEPAEELPYRVRRHEEGYRTGRSPHLRDGSTGDDTA